MKHEKKEYTAEDVLKVFKTLHYKSARGKEPWGFRREGDRLSSEPRPDMLIYLLEAFDFVEAGGSGRQAAAYCSDKTGVYLSHEGFRRLRQIYRPKKRTAKEKRAIAERKRQLAPKTPEEKEAKRLKAKIAQNKRSITMRKKKLNELSSKVEEKYGRESEIQVEQAPEVEPEVIFKPNDGPQTQFLASSEREVLFGGAAGGGKTYAIIADPMRYFHNKNFNGLVLRRTNDELREIVWKTQEMYPKAFPGAKWAEKKSQWTFPSGARLWLTYLERPEDVLRYQGQAFSYIAFDELTQHPTPFAWDYMRSRLRTTDADLPLCMRATTNPGGPGHGWVKRMFIDPAPKNTRFAATDQETGLPLTYPKGHEKEGEPLFYRRFIPSNLYDNPYLTEDGQYEANLLSLPENQRRQLLEGDWDVADGAAFAEFRQNTHVCEPFEIPHEWRRFRSADFGYSSYSAVHWYAVDPAFETLYVYRELYLSKHTGRDLAKAVNHAEEGEFIQYGVLDSSCWHQRGQLGPSIAEEMINEGCRWRPSDRSSGSRVAGKNRLHELLKVNEETERPGIVFFNTCRQIISDLPIIPSCPKGSDDIDVKYASDHAYDSIRYGIMSRPKPFSPFDQFNRGIVKPRHNPADARFGY